MSCGYQFGQGTLSSRYPTISVPFVIGDQTGEVTSALIHQISTSSTFAYRQSGGSAILQVKILQLRDENIGYRYDRERDGELTDTLIPTETRIHLLAEVTLVDAATGCAVLGPTKIASSVDFDHAYYASPNGVNVFSLGQLTDFDDAKEGVNTPLIESLVQKIVDFIANNW